MTHTSKRWVVGMSCLAALSALTATSGFADESSRAVQAVVLFENNETGLSDVAKSTLREFFGSLDKDSVVESVSITGHASPMHRKKYVDPANDNPAARKYNEYVSRQRAQFVARYVFSGEVGAPRKRAKVTGVGYSQAVVAESGVTVAEVCGRYDCARSRRVEVSVVLKKKQTRTLASLPTAKKSDLAVKETLKTTPVETKAKPKAVAKSVEVAKAAPAKKERVAAPAPVKAAEPVAAKVEAPAPEPAQKGGGLASDPLRWLN